VSAAVAALIWALMGALVVAAGLRLRRRLRGVRDEGPRVDDEGLRQILETGRFTSPEDPPLDLGEIAEAEERFWSEPWDEPEP